MAVYQPPEFEVDRDAIYADMVADAEAMIPGLTVAPGTLIDTLLRTFATKHGDSLEQLQERAQGEYQAYGEKILRVPMQQATYASSTVTIIAVDTTGYTLDAGAQISLADASGNRQMFYMPNGATIPAASSTVAGVPIYAVEAGSAGTGLSLDPVLEQPLTWVTDITVDAATTGGEDGETDDEYVDRLADTSQLLAFTLVLPQDFAIYSRNQPGVARALPLDLYNATTSTAGVGGHMTVALVASDGTAVGTGVKATVLALLDENSITNLAVHVIDPTFNTIAVVFTAKCYAGWDPVDVKNRAQQAVLDFLSPANWGRPPFGDPGTVNTWENTPVVRYQDVSAVLNDTAGFAYHTALTINGGTADITMTGAAPLPKSDSTAAGTVTSL